MQYRPLTLPALVVAAAGSVLLGAPAAHADNDVNTLTPNNHRLNDGVVANVYTVQHQAGCTNDVKINPQLQLAAQWQTHDVLKNANAAFARVDRRSRRPPSTRPRPSAASGRSTQ